MQSYDEGENYFVYEHDFESPWLWGNSCKIIFTSGNGRDVGVPKQSCGCWTPFPCKHFRWVYITYFAHRNLGQRSKPTHWQRRFWSERRGYTTHNQTTAFCSYETSLHISWRHVCRVLNAINTNFKLCTLNKKTCLLQSIISFLDTRHMVEQGDDVIRPWKSFVGGLNWCPQTQNLDFFPITRLELLSKDSLLRSVFMHTRQVKIHTKCRYKEWKIVALVHMAVVMLTFGQFTQ